MARDWLSRVAPTALLVNGKSQSGSVVYFNQGNGRKEGGRGGGLEERCAGKQEVRAKRLVGRTLREDGSGWVE